jgi:hypothetical protein
MEGRPLFQPPPPLDMRGRSREGGPRPMGGPFGGPYPRGALRGPPRGPPWGGPPRGAPLGPPTPTRPKGCIIPMGGFFSRLLLYPRAGPDREGGAGGGGFLGGIATGQVCVCVSWTKEL